MNRVGCIALAFALGYLSSPSLSLASLLYYTAFGSVVDNEGRMLPIEGSVYIDDQLRDWSGIGPGQPTEVHDQIGIFSYQYFIAGYSLVVGGYSFSGTSGSLYMPLFRSPTLENWGTGDLMWFLEEGDANSQWSQWVGEHFYFYNSDGTAQEINQYGTLADTINLNQMMYLRNDPVLPDGPPFSLWLTKGDNANPAPEPSTMALLGAGALAMLIRRKRRRESVSPPLQSTPHLPPVTNARNRDA